MVWRSAAWLEPGGCYHLKWAVANFQTLDRPIAAGGSGQSFPFHSRIQPGHAMLPDGTKV